MTTPRDPSDTGWFNQPSEYSWGPGMVNPANVTGEPDYGSELPHPALESESANYERAVADRRTDSTDPASDRDFTTLGNPDRYGAQPPLVQAKPQKQAPKPGPVIKTGVTRAR